MLHAVHAQHVVTEAQRDDQRQLARVRLAAIRTFAEAWQFCRCEPDVDAPGLPVEPQPRPAVEARVLVLLAAYPELIRRAEVEQVAIAMQRHHRIRECTERERPLLLVAPHRLPRRGEKLRRRTTGVRSEIRFGRNKLALRAACDRLPTRRRAVVKLAQPAVNHRQFAGERRDGDGCVRRAGAGERDLFVVSAAAQIERVTGPQLPRRVGQRLPRRGL